MDRWINGWMDEVRWMERKEGNVFFNDTLAFNLRLYYGWMNRWMDRWMDDGWMMDE